MIDSCVERWGASKKYKESHFREIRVFLMGFTVHAEVYLYQSVQTLEGKHSGVGAQ